MARTAVLILLLCLGGCSGSELGADGGLLDGGLGPDAFFEGGAESRSDAASGDAEMPDAGQPDLGVLDAGIADAALGPDSGPAADAGPTPDASAPVDAAPNPTDPVDHDFDCDGLTDLEEFAVVLPSGAQTLPSNPDTDGDGLWDGLEVGRVAEATPQCSALFRPDTEPATRTDPTRADSDGDGLTDGEEDANLDGAFDGGLETDPNHPDTDRDGLCDGPIDVVGVCSGLDPDPFYAENDNDRDGITNDIDAFPEDSDADGDGLCDGPSSVGACVAGEDLDADGIVSAGETDPATADTDCDGLADGFSYGAFLGERSLGTDARNPDTDSDGIFDGIEAGASAAPVVACTFLDADPSFTTDPNDADSDGDGVQDGAEDSNQDGAVDPGELDPRNAADAATNPTIANACATENLVPIVQRRTFEADVQTILADAGAARFDQVLELTVASTAVGLAAFNSSLGVGFLLFSQADDSADSAAVEAAARATLQGLAALSVPVTNQFTTWDAYPAVRASYQQSGPGIGTKARLNAIAAAFLPGVETALDVGDDVLAAAEFSVQAEFVRRSEDRTVILIAVASDTALADEDAGFALNDLADGGAVGQYADIDGLKCTNIVAVENTKLDIIWAVDNSVSMADEQAEVALAADGMAASLSNSTIDWRTALVSSAFFSEGRNAPRCTARSCGESNQHSCGAEGDACIVHQCRYFTSDAAQFQGWLTEDTSATSTWIDAGPTFGHDCNQPREEVVRGAQLILWDQAISVTPAGPVFGMGEDPYVTFMPVSATDQPDRVREDAQILVIFLGDADDQFFNNSQAADGILQYESFFQSLESQGIAGVNLAAIVCENGCGETIRNPHVILGVVNAFGGVIGALDDNDDIQPTIDAIVDDIVGEISPYTLTEPAIPWTIRVAIASGQTLGACDTESVPRSRVHGWDYDSENQTVAFFGDCRPESAAGIAISYRHWIDQSPNPDDSPCPICDQCAAAETCDAGACECVCEASQTCAPGYAFDAAICGCACDADVLGCETPRVADLEICGCACEQVESCDAEDTFNFQTCACQCDGPALECAGDFVPDLDACACVCDIPALGCGGRETVDLDSCVCECQPDCGGCPGFEQCDPVACACVSVDL